MCKILHGSGLLFPGGRGYTSGMMKNGVLPAFFAALLLVAADVHTCAAEGEGTLRVGVLPDRPPLAFVADGRLRGLGVELARDMGRELGKEVVLIQGRSVELYELLARGEIDVAVCLPRIAGVAPQLRFIPTGFSLNRRIFVTDPGIDVRSEHDFRGRRLILVESDIKYARLAHKAGADVVFARDIPSGLELLGSHGADAFVAPLGEVAASLAWRAGLTGVTLKGGSLERTELYLVTEEKNFLLSSRLAKALTDLEQKGRLTELRETWLGLPLWERSFFERYGERIAYLGLGIGMCITLSLGWNFSLRRRVSAATVNLRASEARYRELTEASPDAVMLLGGEGALLYANPVAQKLLAPGGVWLPGSVEGVVGGLKDLACGITGGQALSREYVLSGENGETRHFEVVAFPATLDGQENPGVCALWRDISARRIMERELARADRMSIIGRMAAGVAHEINNPLGVIMANAEYLAEKGVGGTQVEAILAHGERAESTIQRLLHLAVSPEARRESVNLSGIVRECFLFLQPRLRKVELAVDLPEWLPVRGDRGMLEQVVLNLVINALDSMEDAGRLNVKGEVLQKEKGSVVRLSVTDNGAGIAGSDTERIFDLFYSTKGSHGFGIGLYVARNIAEMHQGLLYAESQPGETRFILELPLLA